LTLGSQIVLSSFFLSVLDMGRKSDARDAGISQSRGPSVLRSSRK
jgi:hypothetical protein